MNILRWKRKSKKKINYKTVLLFIFSLIMTTFAWFAYTKVLNTNLDIHVASWDIEYYIEDTKKTNPITIDIFTLYPTMPQEQVTIDIKNNGETLVDIQYEIKSVTIAGISYEMVEEGKNPTSENYIALASPVLEQDSTTGEYIYKGAITNDITKFPFTIELEHSAQVEAVKEDLYGNMVTGEGYLKVKVNWIGDNNDLDSEWGYIVGEYFANNAEATSAMSIELSIDSYQAEGEIQEITQQLPSTAETIPYLPTGFSRLAGTNLDNGLVIKDTSGNEFVWIEVPKSSTVYVNSGLNITEFSEADYTNIETDLRSYTSTYGVRADEYTSYKAIGLSEDNYNSLKQNMLKSVYQNGGFYIGRYETGIADSFRVSATASTPTQTPVIKANAYPYNYVTCAQAQTVATRISAGEHTTSLMFGLQWNLVMKYLETKGTAQLDLNTDSTSWGNYNNNRYSLTNINAKYSLDDGVSWLIPPYDKGIDITTILTTGANSIFCKQNIYDLAGNLVEWTFNLVFDDGNAIGGNGGDYTTAANNFANSRGSYNATKALKQNGFRITLF